LHYQPVPYKVHMAMVDNALKGIFYYFNEGGPIGFLFGHYVEKPFAVKSVHPWAYLD